MMTSDDNDVHDLPLMLKGELSDEIRLIFQWVLYSVVIEVINVLGTVTNIINIICFIKLGFADAVNISLLGLAVSDLGSIISLIWTGICSNPVFNKLDLPFEPIEVQYLTAGGPHIIFTRVTSCITAFITLERCLCVTMPLKVKLILNPSKVKVVIVSIFVSVVGFLLLIYCGSGLGEKFSSIRNRTIIGAVYVNWNPILEAIVYTIGGISLELVTFATVVICTIIVVVKLRNKIKWRQMSVAQTQTDTASKRDQKVTKMVIMISTLFIICFIPTSVSLIDMTIERELSAEGGYRNLFICIFSVCFALESLNSSTNIFIYYHMSSKYRMALQHILKCRHR